MDEGDGVGVEVMWLADEDGWVGMGDITAFVDIGNVSVTKRSPSFAEVEAVKARIPVGKAWGPPLEISGSKSGSESCI